MLSFIHSIRFRLVLWFVFILGMVLAGFSLFVYYSQARDLRTASVDYLERRIGRLQEILASRPGSDTAVLIMPADFLQDTDELVLLDQGGNVLASHGPLLAEEVLQLFARGMQEQSQQQRIQPSTPWAQENTSAHIEYTFVLAPLCLFVSLSPNP